MQTRFGGNHFLLSAAVVSLCLIAIVSVVDSEKHTTVATMTALTVASIVDSRSKVRVSCMTGYSSRFRD